MCHGVFEHDRFTFVVLLVIQILLASEISSPLVCICFMLPCVPFENDMVVTKYYHGTRMANDILEFTVI